MFDGVVEAGRGLPPFLVHVVKVVAVASGYGHFGEYGRRHVERITPPPEEFRGIVGAGKQLVEDLFGVGHADVIVRSQTRVEIKAVSYTHLDVYKRQAWVR